jgi:methionyl-tRNA formyltransferase
MGTPESAVPTLEACLRDNHEVVAVWTQPDRPSGRGNKLKPPPVKEFAIKNHLPVYQPAKIRTPESLELFRSHESDVAIVVAYGRILPVTFLQTPKLGCVNVHFSLLPKYRGAAPVNWAIINGEELTGVSTMKMDEGLDTGPILLQTRTRIEACETTPELMSRLSYEGADLLKRTLKEIHKIVPKEQRPEESSLAPILKKEDGLINWQLSATEIERRVRGLQPWPAAYTHFSGGRLVLWRAAVEEIAHHLAPGQIVLKKHDKLVVACGSGSSLGLVELQPEGRRRMQVKDFLNGARIEPGETFQ